MSVPVPKVSKGPQKWSPCLICLKNPKDRPACIVLDSLSKKNRHYSEQSHLLFFPPVLHQEVEWAQFDNKGQAMGNGCKADMAVIILAWPQLSWEEAGANYHSKTDKTFKADVNAAKKMYLALSEKQSTPFSPSSSVIHTSSQSMVAYYEAAFLTEAEVVRLTGLACKSMKGLGPKVTLVLEDGQSCLQGWYFSLRGLSPIEAASVRKVRFESKVSVQHDECLLDPSRQIRKEQGKALYDFAAAKQLASMDSIIQPANRVNLKDLAALKEKALEQQEDRWV